MKLININDTIINTEHIAYAELWAGTNVRVVFHGLPEKDNHVIVRCKSKDEAIETLKKLVK
jgi:hypothetical protein